MNYIQKGTTALLLGFLLYCLGLTQIFPKDIASNIAILIGFTIGFIIVFIVIYSEEQNKK